MEILHTDVALAKLQRIGCPYRGEYCSTISIFSNEFSYAAKDVNLKNRNPNSYVVKISDEIQVINETFKFQEFIPANET